MGAETPEITADKDVRVGVDEVQQTFKKLKPRKSQEPDYNPNNLLKYGGQYLTLYRILRMREWRINETILMFKKWNITSQPTCVS